MSTTKARAIPPNPYRGLFAFREQDAHFFFGRETVIQTITEHLQSKDFLAVVGASGSGKSSLIFAGLVPALKRDENWLAISCRPGRDPFLALASALLDHLEEGLNEREVLKERVALAKDLASQSILLSHALNRIKEKHPEYQILLIIDQFEELYTIGQQTQLQAAEQEEVEEMSFDPTPFLYQLLTVVQGTEAMKVVFSLRADFMASVLAYGSFVETLQEAEYLLGPMSEENLRDAIEKPAQKQGVAFEEGLTRRILDEVKQKVGNLPLLEFALSQLWTLQEDGVLTHTAYDEIGGVEQALVNHAQEALRGLSDEDRSAVQKIFLQLVHPGEGQEDTRRVATQAEIGAENWELVTKLADNRLVVTGQDVAGQRTAEVIHEALIQRWGAFKDWINRHREFRGWQDHLRQNLKLWQENDESKNALLTGFNLDRAEDMLGRYEDYLSEDERRFIRESAENREQQRAQVEAQRQREIDALKARAEEQKLRIAAETARSEAEEARAQEAEARVVVERQSAVRLKRRLYTSLGGFIIALIFAIIAINRQQLANHRTRLAQARELVAQAQVDFEEEPLLSIQIALAGLDRIPPGEDQAKASLRSIVNELASEGHLMKLGDNIEHLHANEDNSVLIISYRGWPTKVYFDGWREEYELKEGIRRANFSPDGRWFVTDYVFERGELRSTANPEKHVKLSGIINSMTVFIGEEVNFSPNGNWIVLSYFSEPGELRSTADPRTFVKLTGKVRRASFSSNENWFVVAYFSSLGELRSTADLESVMELAGVVESANFNPDGNWFVVDYEDRVGELRSTADPETAVELPSKIHSIYQSDNITISPDSRWFVVDYEDRVGELRSTADPEMTIQLTGEVAGVIFSRDGTQILIEYANKPGELRSTADPEMPVKLTDEVAHYSIRNPFSPDGRWFIASYYNALGELRSTENPNIVVDLADVIDNVAFSPDGRWFVVKYRYKPDELRSTEDPKIIKKLAGEVDRVTFNSDGTWLVLDYLNRGTDLWDLSAGPKFIKHFGLGLHRTEFSYDNSRLAITYYDGRGYLLDLDWLHVMKGEPESFDDQRLKQIICDGPIASNIAGESKLRRTLQVDVPLPCS